CDIMYETPAETARRLLTIDCRLSTARLPAIRLSTNMLYRNFNPIQILSTKSETFERRWR
ncbi:hypothetical protein M1N19_03745, partial [Dehalococcoidia bacterium]|nr:hypothetical protein [Dehalococcoidia bacterium]